ncbi:hypothetical protein SAY86_000735 [Trapa natans]|uniref:Late embryogenesis abundant protein LEA-2 subgroup domain-containing protein n=1 Tax=Trapa natans TaxID=22666 RepID=A0AAN7RFW6_TRANT|nr:hypothetical protein SAY86_000735 [Trapa natans]
MAKDMESFQSQEEKQRKRMRLVAAFAVFQVIVILVFALVVMKVKTPKFRVSDDIAIHGLNAVTGAGQSSQVASFDVNFTAPVRIKNTNFGPYKYDAATVSFTYGGVEVGQAAIPKGKANLKSTKKVDVAVTVSSSAVAGNSNLGRELRSGVLTMNSRGRLYGKVELMFIFKKKKSTEMNCSISINVASKAVQSVPLISICIPIPHWKIKIHVFLFECIGRNLTDDILRGARKGGQLVNSLLNSVALS